MRLTLLYGVLFLGPGAALLAITYGLATSQLSSNLLSQDQAAAPRPADPAPPLPPAVAGSTRGQQAAYPRPPPRCPLA